MFSNNMLNMLKGIWGAVKKVMEPISKVMSGIVNFILLLLVYIIGIGLVSIFAKIFRKHFLQLKKQSKNSNWDEHKVEKQPLEKYYRTF